MKKELMSIINNSYLNSTSLSSQSTQTSLVSQTTTTTDADAQKQSVKLEGSDIVVSSRAQKLRALSDEFFAGSGLNSGNIAALTERAYEYGLLSDTQYKSLNNGVTTTTVQTALPTTQSLSEELERVSKELEKRNQEVPEHERQDVSSITNILNRAASILTDPETAITKEQFSQDIANTIQDLNVIIDSDTFGNLPVTERTAITNSTSALSTIEALAPRNLTNSKVNQYLANSLR